ncbi:methanogenesis marker 9 domain-containing protein [Methanolobus halotolerans]|uniref:Methanogenesis marker 9 domain-containing protein n=1 Tax=Methanolobus halotolerans TaxID=2052935 RepID=A0A4E0Q9K4_9EURY|nr:methanogenesis marker 9 domain-containing protein [Methanolobus halotolerans]TGC11590.1 methanogenesis marker 9 domain-containing protein [Methanolobus halotolerans]
MPDELFDLKAGYVNFKNPIALAPMGGITDSDFANKHAADAGLVILGGYNLDEKTQSAASDMIARGREEFIAEDPFKFIEQEIMAVSTGAAVAVNVRSTSIGPLLKAAAIAKDAGAILELDAHCRQEEMTSIGTGQALLYNIPLLTELIKKIKGTGVVLSVKVRGNVVDDLQLTREIESAGADILHLDAMMEGAGADLKLIMSIRDSTRMFLICNNSVTDPGTAKDMFSRGADMVSVARGVLENPALISHLVKNVTILHEDMGWYNAPKHVCRGEGDLRGLTFCCLPVKQCPVHGKIKTLGLTAQEFVDIKMEFAKGTILEYGDSTCFGSLVWCCKISKPCFLRDGVLETLGLSDAEYMRLKKELADHILENVKPR